jgi:hypothetical protein
MESGALGVTRKPVFTEIHARTSVSGGRREAKLDMTRDVTGPVPDMIRIGVRIKSEAHHGVTVASNAPKPRHLGALNEHGVHHVSGGGSTKSMNLGVSGKGVNQRDALTCTTKGLIMGESEE